MIQEKLIREEILQHKELNDINVEELFRFLNKYKKENIIYVSCLQRKFPYVSKDKIDLLFNIFFKTGFVIKVSSYYCPVCNHNHLLKSEELRNIKEYEEFSCNYCGEDTPYNEKYLHFEYKIV